MTPFWVGLVASCALTGLLIPVLRRMRVLDVPNHRSSHHRPTPRGGGVAVMTAVVVATAASGEAQTWALVVPGLLLAAVGMWDDIRSLPAGARLAAQVVTAVGVTLWIVAEVGRPDSWFWLFLVVAALAVVAFVNAFNFMDGINGISALNAALAGGWYAWLGHDEDLTLVLVVGAALAGAALGFLPWNAGARVFLGDVGSYGIGALLSGMAVATLAAGVSPVLAVAPLVVYLADTGVVIAKRVRARASLTEPHRDHTYQRLVRQGLPHLASASICAGASAVVCLSAAAWARDRPALAVAAMLLVVTLYLLSPRARLGDRTRSGVTT